MLLSLERKRSEISSLGVVLSVLRVASVKVNKRNSKTLSGRSTYTATLLKGSSTQGCPTTGGRRIPLAKDARKRTYMRNFCYVRVLFTLKYTIDTTVRVPRTGGIRGWLAVFGLSC